MAISRTGSQRRHARILLPFTNCRTTAHVRPPSSDSIVPPTLRTMTSIPLPDSEAASAVTVYDEAEKGTLELPSARSTVATFGVNNEKVDEIQSQASTVISSDVPVRSEVAKPPAKGKVSKWILWTLWFNTYRWVSIVSTSRISDSASGLIQ